MRLVISSGHGSKVRGASGYLDEVDEARKVVERVADTLRGANVEVDTFHDDVSTSQNENLERIVDFHNSKTRDLDVSVHFNAYQTTSKPMGTECLYVTQQALASVVASAMAEAGSFINRGPKKRTDLYFLNQTEMPSVLLEVCFVDSVADADLYREYFDDICIAIAEGLTGIDLEEPDRPPVQPPEPEPEPEPDTPTVDIQIQTSGQVKITVNGIPVSSTFV
jgi:N-acetylmuramoyl-L-alanine amidase